MSKIGLDVDGVIADFYGSMCDKYDAPYERVSCWDLPLFDDNRVEILSDKEFWGGLKILNHPEILNFHFDYYVTAIPEYLSDVRRNWLEKNGFPDRPMIVAYDKVSACRELGIKIMIDDKPDTMLKFSKEKDLVGIQYIPPYSDMDVFGDYQVTCLSEIKPLLSKLKGF